MRRPGDDDEETLATVETRKQRKLAKSGSKNRLRINPAVKNGNFWLSIAQKHVEIRGCHQNMNFGSKLIHNCVKALIGGIEWVLSYRGKTKCNINPNW